MAYATGLRLLAALMFALSCTLILAPVCFPLGVVFIRKAKQQEREKEELQEAIKQNVDTN